MGNRLSPNRGGTEYGTRDRGTPRPSRFLVADRKPIVDRIQRLLRGLSHGAALTLRQVGVDYQARASVAKVPMNGG